MLTPLVDYYQISYKVKGQTGDDEFDFALCLRRSDVFTGDGADLGNGSDGQAQLLAIAEGEASSAPYWRDMRVVAIDASPSAAVRLYSESPGQ